MYSVYLFQTNTAPRGMQQYSTFMPGPVAPPQVPNPTYSATTPWGRGKEMEQATNLAATVGNSGINHLINQNQNQKHQTFVNLPMSASRTQVRIFKNILLLFFAQRVSSRISNFLK